MKTSTEIRGDTVSLEAPLGGGDAGDHKDVHELFQLTIPPDDLTKESQSHVPINLFDTDRHVVAHLGLPGCREAGVRLFLEGNVLTVRAERHVGAEQADGMRRYLVRELPSGTLVRRITLPLVGLRKDEVKAYFADGMLTVIIPKDEANRIREVPIHAR